MVTRSFRLQEYMEVSTLLETTFRLSSWKKR